MTDAAPPAPAPASVQPDPAKKGIRWVLLLIVLSLAWYLLADRYTPYTQQARVGAFVIPVAAEVAGRVIRVNVRNNQDVKAGDVLFELDPQPLQIAVDRAKADLESTRRQVGASTAGIASAQASLRAAQANELKTRQDNRRLEGLYKEDPGTVSVRLLEVSRANHEAAVSQVAAARAEVLRAQEQEGGNTDTNQTCIVVVQVRLPDGKQTQMGAIVDAVEEVTTISAESIEETPEFGGAISAECLVGLAKLKGSVKALLDIDKVMGAGAPIETAVPA